MFNLILLIPIIMVLYYVIKNTNLAQHIKSMLRYLATKEGVKTLLITLLIAPIVLALLTFVFCLPR